MQIYYNKLFDEKVHYFDMYVRKIDNVLNDDLSCYYVKIEIDKLPMINIEYSDTWSGAKGKLTIIPNVEIITVDKFKKLLKTIKKSKYPKETAEQMVDSLEIQKDIYMWFLQVTNIIKHKITDYLNNGSITPKEYKEKIRILKHSFDKAKKFKDKTIKYIAEFEKIAGDKCK